MKGAVYKYHAKIHKTYYMSHQREGDYFKKSLCKAGLS